MYRIVRRFTLVSAFVMFTTLMMLTMGGNSYVAAQGQFEPEVNALLSNFIICWGYAEEVGIQNMPPNERSVCRVLMDNSHAALNHIFNAGTISTYSQETQDLAYQAAKIIVPYVVPYNSPALTTEAALQSTMDSSASDAFFDALGTPKSGYLTGGQYGDVCNYTLDNCVVTDPDTGNQVDIPFSEIPESSIELVPPDE